MEGVRGAPEDPYGDDQPLTLPYAAHGTFVAGLVRTMAPSADVWVEPTLIDSGAVYETYLVSTLLDTPLCTATRKSSCCPLAPTATETSRRWVS
jgi:hypothetical protein